MRIMNFSAHIMNVFAQNETDYEGLKNLMSDLAMHREMFDADGNKIPKAVAEKTLLNITRQFFGLSEGFTPRDMNRANLQH